MFEKPLSPTKNQYLLTPMSLQLTRRSRLAAIAGLATSIGIASQAFAKSPIGAEPASSIWDVSLIAGVSLTSGNTDTLGAHAGLNAEKITDVDETYLGLDFLYGEDSGARTNESLTSYAQYNRLLSERAYFGLVGEFLYDDIAAVDYRFGITPTLGYYLIKNDRTRLAIEVGAGYVWEDVGGTKDEYIAARVAERLTHQLTESLSLFQSVVFSAEAEDFNNYTIDARAGIESRVSDRMSLRIFAQNRYDNTPASGLEKNDFGVFSGISLAMGAVEPMASSGAKGGAVGGGGSDWDVDLGVGFSLTSGNTDTLSVTADLFATRFTAHDETFLGAGIGYGETSGTRNSEFAYAFAQRNFLVSERAYLGARADFRYDDITALDYRITPAVVAGYYLIKNDTTQLALEVGPSYTFEDQAGIESNYFGVYAGERFSHQLNDRVALWQTAGLVLDVNNTDNYVIDASIGIDIGLGDRLSWRTQAQNIYDNDTPEGVDGNDFRLTSGIVLSF